MNFAEFVGRATRWVPYGYQQALAGHGLPDVLAVPTGAGKTLAAVLPWLWRRTEHPDETVRAAAPRWLVVVLPQRALVEQIVTKVREWLANLGSDVPVHLLMGGEDPEDRAWKSHPEIERIFVGTQDMVLSRLLMRGFAESRGGWPMSFGLLHAGVQFVFDEVQLMGPGLSTSLQLQGLREALGTAQPCRTMWMSATVDKSALSTPDFPGDRPLNVVELGEADRSGALAVRLTATRTVRRIDLGDIDSKRYARALAERVLAEHRPGTRTLVVLNVVDRATDVFEALATSSPAADLVLLHSRFRPGDRAQHTDRALGELAPQGTIVVTTQVLEAGIDITSDTLVTEVAPWSSIVQRAGRCNRDGQALDARLLWVSPPPGRSAHLPYEADELAHTANVLTALAGQPLTSTQLAEATSEIGRPVHPMLRRRDLLDLFDTAPDLSGNDIDVSPFIRDADDRTVCVAWRAFPDDELGDMPAVGRAELCPAPLAAVREMIGSGRTRIRVYDQAEGRWHKARREDVRPTAVLVLDAACGGYLPERGFSLRSTRPVAPVPPPPAPPDAADTDPQSMHCRDWVPLADHLADTEREARTLLDRLGPLPGLTTDQREAIALAARYHDLGKAHPEFIADLEKANPQQPPPASGIAWAKSPGTGVLRHARRHFRHELVSALLLLDESTGLLDGVAERDLVLYLALAHHGKVRVTVRGRPDEPEDTVLGVQEGDQTVEVELPGGGRLAARTLSLAPTRLGAGSLTSRALALRDRPDLGPFRVTFSEALVRSADWCASAHYDGSPA